MASLSRLWTGCVRSPRRARACASGWAASTAAALQTQRRRRCGRFQPFAELIKDELNVRDLELANLGAGGAAYGVTQVLQVNARAAGPRLGKDVQTVTGEGASKRGEWSVDENGTVISGGSLVQEGEYANVGVGRG